MKLVMPGWLKHEDGANQNLAILSIDIHPDGSKVATGGQGNDGGRVIIWNMLPIKSSKAELNNGVPKIFAQIDCHRQCVNVLRWSNSGNFLASAGDDQRIMIWILSERQAGPGPTEQYRNVSTLQGISGMLLDLSWSPKDQFISVLTSTNCLQIWSGTDQKSKYATFIDCPMYNGHYWVKQANHSPEFQGNLEHNENQSQMNDERVILDEEATDSLSVSGDDSHLSGQLSEREPALNPKLIDHLLYTQNTTQLWLNLEQVALDPPLVENCTEETGNVKRGETEEDGRLSGDELELETPVKKKSKMDFDETPSKPSDGHNGNLQAHKSGSSSNWPSPRSSSSVEMQPNEQLAQRTTHLTLWTKIGKSEAKVLPKKSKGTIRLLCLELSPDGKLILSSQVVRNNGTIENNASNQDCEDLDDLLSQRRKTPYARINRASFGAAPGKQATLSMRQLTACASRSPVFTICDSLHCPMTHSCILNYGTSVVDFSWSAGGYQLMACSSASEVAYLDFAKCDLGRPYRVANAEGLPDEEDDEYWHKIPVKTNAQWRAYLKKGTH